MNFMGMGPLEVIFVLLIALVVLGPSQVIEAAQGLGKFLRAIRKITSNWPSVEDILDQVPQRDSKTTTQTNPEKLDSAPIGSSNAESISLNDDQNQIQPK